jgi:hypothetical protein
MFKLKDEILVPDRRFAVLHNASGSGLSSMTIEDHHHRVGAISIDLAAPLDVRVLFDRARNVFLYAWYCYELLVVSEMQAFGALELALKLRLLGSSEAISGLSSLLQQARQDGLLPSNVDGVDELDALLAMRNALAHGAMEFHTPDMSLATLSVCADVVNRLYARPGD